MTDPKIATVNAGIFTLDRVAPLPELQAHLAEAAAIMARLPDNERAGWLCYLLEELEALRTHGGNAPMRRDYEEWLRDVQADVRDRLRRGTW